MSGNTKNIKVTVEGDKLTMVVDLSKDDGLSKSGKSVMIATTSGNMMVPGRESIRIGLNVFDLDKTRLHKADKRRGPRKGKDEVEEDDEG